MTFSPFSILLGLALSLLMAYWALRRRSLSWLGFGATVVGGTLVFALGGWAWGLTVVVFFVTITIVSHYRRRVKDQLAPELAEGAQRGFWQVVANGGPAVIMAMASFFFRSDLLLAAFIGAMAGANGDTWSSELGMLARRLPRMVTNWRQVPPGTSGAVTLLGTGAAAAGGLAVGVAAYVFLTLESYLTGTGDITAHLWLVPLAFVGALVGSFFDSFLGATVQAIYYCDLDRKETESPVHRCGTRTRLIRGWSWMSNDVVNFLASLVGAATGLAFYLFLRP